MATRRPAGIGKTGLGRAQENLGRPQDTPELEEALFRSTPPLQRAQALRTPWVNVASSRVAQYMYDYTTSTLFLRWVKYGTTWAYYNVSTALFESFVSAPSKGRYVNSTLNVHNYAQVFDT